MNVEDHVLTLLDSREWLISEIAVRSGLTEQAATLALKRLRKKGLVVRSELNVSHQRFVTWKRAQEVEA